MVVGCAAHHLYILNILHQKESDIRQSTTSTDQAQGYIRHPLTSFATSSIWRKTASTVSSAAWTCSAAIPAGQPAAILSAVPGVQLRAEHHLSQFARFAERPDPVLEENFVAAYDLNRVFFIGGDSLCMAESSAAVTRAPIGKTC
ncbi:hypothetical protein M8494_04575 [Serratia ureilytica]